MKGINIFSLLILSLYRKPLNDWANERLKRLAYESHYLMFKYLFSWFKISHIDLDQFARNRFFSPGFLYRRMNCRHNGYRLTGMKVTHWWGKLNRYSIALVTGGWIHVRPCISDACVVGMIDHWKTNYFGFINIAITKAENVIFPRFNYFFWGWMWTGLAGTFFRNRIW